MDYLKIFKKYIFIITAVIIIFSAVGVEASYSFSRDMEEFIRDGKKVSLLLSDHRKSITVTPCQNINLAVEDRPEGIILKAEQEYEIRFKSADNILWRIQVFASSNKKRASEIIDDLKDDGYQDISLIQAGSLYKVQLGNFAERSLTEGLAEKLDEDGWPNWTTDYKKSSAEREIGLYGPGGELLLSGREFAFNGKLRFFGECYQGDFEFIYNKYGMKVLNTAPFSGLVAGILSSEIEGRARLSHPKYSAALRSQAVAIRTKLLYDIFNDNKDYHEIKEYKGIDGLEDYVKKAVTDTSGRVIIYNDDLINAVYHRNSGGYTADSSYFLKGYFPYLLSQEDSRSVEDPLFLAKWSYYWSEEKLLKHFSLYFDKEVNGIRDITSVRVTPSGRAVNVRLRTDYGTYQLSGDEIQDFFQLDSLKFEFEKEYNSGYLMGITFSGIGMGSGLGLSQDGAQVMARRGKNYDEILQYYYQNVDIIDLNKKSYLRELVSADVIMGLKYKEYRQLTWAGEKIITLLDFDLTNETVLLQNFLAGKELSGLADLAEVVRERKAVAGINGGFYSYTGRPLGLFVRSGEIVSESLYDRAALARTSKGKIMIDRVSWQGKMRKTAGDGEIIVTAANRSPEKGEIVIYNNYYGKKAPIVEPDMEQMVVMEGRIVSMTDNITILGTPIPENGFILQSKGRKKGLITGFSKDDRVEFINSFNNSLWNEEHVIEAIGGGPMLIDDGRISITGKKENFQNDILYGRAPRTAVGLTDNDHLVFFTVDGRQPELSIGITLKELARFMKEYGIKDAMNLDGGGSARMVVRGFTMNNPSEERLISNGILFFKN